MAKTGRMRTVGVEEELLLVDAVTGAPMAVADQVLQLESARVPQPADDEDTPGGRLEAELQQQQIETDTTPSESIADLATQVRRARATADSLARRTGARIAALATSPLPSSPEVTVKPRYQAMIEHFGLVTLDQLTCGCHVHVSVDSAEEGVAVLDRIRVWLPTLLALSANSPYWQGRDSGYASFRSVVWNRFPTAGPYDVFGSLTGYSALVEALVGSGVALDTGMIYFDARLSARYPTVEVRIADVCLDADDTVLIAALTRALVETAARDWAGGRPTPPMATALLRGAGWRAARSSLGAELLDPASGTARPASEVVAALVAHVADALADSGDRELVDSLLAGLFARGPGAIRQRQLLVRSGDLSDVVLAAADDTLR